MTESKTIKKSIILAAAFLLTGIAAIVVAAENTPRYSTWCGNGLRIYSVPLKDGREQLTLAPSHGQIGGTPVLPRPLFVVSPSMVSQALVSTHRSGDGQAPGYSATLLIARSEAMKLAAILDVLIEAPLTVASCEQGKYFGIVAFPFPFRAHVELFGGAYVDISVATEELAARTANAFSVNSVKDKRGTETPHN